MPPNKLTDEDWVEYRRLILDTLKRLDEKLSSTETEINELKTTLRLMEQEVAGKVGNTDFQVMKTKVSFWVTIAAALVTTLVNVAIKTLFE